MCKTSKLWSDKPQDGAGEEEGNGHGAGAGAVALGVGGWGHAIPPLSQEMLVFDICWEENQLLFKK